MSYIEGPIEREWEVERVGGIFWVQRAGWNERNMFTKDQEVIFEVDTEEQAEALVARLNELDRLRRIEALALAWHNAILATNGVYDAEQALRAALQPKESQ